VPPVTRTFIVCATSYVVAPIADASRLPTVLGSHWLASFDVLALGARHSQSG
jgi:hypothetical protein